SFVYHVGELAQFAVEAVRALLGAGGGRDAVFVARFFGRGFFLFFDFGFGLFLRFRFGFGFGLRLAGRPLADRFDQFGWDVRRGVEPFEFFGPVGDVELDQFQDHAFRDAFTGGAVDD